MKKIFIIILSSLFLASCKSSSVKFKDSNLFESPPFYDEITNRDIPNDNKK